MELYQDYIHIYTDASKIIDGKVGAAFSVPSLKIEQYARITDGLSIYTAKMTALKMAGLWVKQFEKLQKVAHKYVIFSDSLSSLQSLDTNISNSRPNLLLELKDILNSISSKITICWIPSHVGIRGNEIGDKLANLATKKAIVETSVELELREDNILIENFIIQKW